MGGNIIHAVDIIVVTLLLFLSDGFSSPFLVFFTFVLLAASLRWDWQGIAATTATLTLLAVAIAIYRFFPGADRVLISRIQLSASRISSLLLHFWRMPARIESTSARGWPSSRNGLRQHHCARPFWSDGRNPCAGGFSPRSPSRIGNMGRGQGKSESWRCGIMATATFSIFQVMDRLPSSWQIKRSPALFPISNH